MTVLRLRLSCLATEAFLKPRSFSCWIALYTEYPFISRRLRLWLAPFYQLLGGCVVSGEKLCILWRKSVYSYWLKSVHFILPFTFILAQTSFIISAAAPAAAAPSITAFLLGRSPRLHRLSQPFSIQELLTILIGGCQLIQKTNRITVYPFMHSITGKPLFQCLMYSEVGP